MPRDRRNGTHIVPDDEHIPPRRKPGRPKNQNIITLDWEKIAGWVEAGCDGIQCAAMMGVHPDTIYERCVQEHNTKWTDWAAKQRASGDAMLLAAQYRKAVKDAHPTMMIWLGKQRLGQKENPDSLEERANATVDAIAALSQLTQTVSPELLEAISRLTPEQQHDIIKTAAKPAKCETDTDDS